ncbi:AMP-dependent synthetase/ligase [Thermoproteota archaeon]
MKQIHHLQAFVYELCKRGDAPALSWMGQDSLKTMSFTQLHCSINEYSKAFLELGMEKGDRVAIFSRNIPEWICLTLAINNSGLIDVPRGENSTEDEINYILEHSQAKIVITEAQCLDKVSKNRHKQLKHIITIQPVKHYLTLSDLEKIGKKSKKMPPQIMPDDTASIIYTSGTTGVPKGVELTHYNFMSQLSPILSRLSLTPEDKGLSILPAWHVFERMAKYITLISGVEVYYSSQKTLMQDMLEHKPTLMASVPRIWEAVYDRAMKKIKAGSSVQKFSFDVLYQASINYVKQKQAGLFQRLNPINLIRAPLHSLLEKKLYNELRKRVGGRLRFAISGGSSLPQHIDDFFFAAGIELVEGYGLTETSPVISVRVPGEKRLYTAGKLIDGVAVKIINPESGETLSYGKEGVIYIKGPNVMRGYYRNFEETRKVLDDEGWFDTGDRGILYKDHSLVVTGREKDIIVLSNGENVNPVPIENALNKSGFIASAVVTGQDWKQLSALVVPDEEALLNYCHYKNLADKDDEFDEILKKSDIKALYKREINQLVCEKTGFKSYERIYDFRFVPAFNIGRELTLTLKPKRARIEELYQKELESMSRLINKIKL